MFHAAARVVCGARQSITIRHSIPLLAERARPLPARRARAAAKPPPTRAPRCSRAPLRRVGRRVIAIGSALLASAAHCSAPSPRQAHAAFQRRARVPQRMRSPTPTPSMRCTTPATSRPRRSPRRPRARRYRRAPTRPTRSGARRASPAPPRSLLSARLRERASRSRDRSTLRCSAWRGLALAAFPCATRFGAGQRRGAAVRQLWFQTRPLPL